MVWQKNGHYSHTCSKGPRQQEGKREWWSWVITEIPQPLSYPDPSPIFHSLQASGQLTGRLGLMQVQEKKEVSGEAG